jgi:D-threo-aldose 1-dehydrogenase
MENAHRVKTGSKQIATRELGSTGLSVSVLGLGGAPLGELFEIIAEKNAQSIIHTAWSGGVRFFDTAPWYGHGQSEHRMGHYLRQQPRAQFALSTKVGRVYRPARDAAHRTPPWVGGLPFELRFDYGYDGIMRSWEDSLMRLGLNRVDLLLIHDLDSGYHGHGKVLRAHQRDLETGGWRALEELRSSGAIRGIGCGINNDGFIPWFLDRFPLDFLLVAMPYTLLDQRALEYALPACAEKGISVVIGSPYASGILATGPVEGAMYNYAPAEPAMLEKTRRIQAICQSHGVSLQAAAIQFPLGHPAVVSVIPGATRAAHVAASLDHLSTRIPAALWTALKDEKLLAPQAPVPTPGRSRT